MNFAYGWAFAKPVRKVYYNLVITGLSIAAAFIIGTIEIFGLLSTELHIRGGFWDFMATFNINKAGSAALPPCSSSSGRWPSATGRSRRLRRPGQRPPPRARSSCTEPMGRERRLLRTWPQTPVPRPHHDFPQDWP